MSFRRYPARGSADPLTTSTLTVTSSAKLAGVTKPIGASASRMTSVGVVYANSTPATTVALASNLMIYALPANALNANGKGVRITGWGTFAANNNTKVVRINFGSTDLVSSFNTTSNNLQWFVQGTVIRTGAATQITSSISATSNASWGRFGQGSAGVSNTAGAINIILSGQSATQAGDITALGMIVEVFN